MNLFIIGNGFDLAHGLATTYMDFREYLEKNDWSFLVELESLYNLFPESSHAAREKFLWKDFEKNLSNINEHDMIDMPLNMDMGLESGDIGIEDTLNDYLEDQYGYIKRLNDYINSWVKQIDICVPKRTRMLKQNTDDLILSFNYTLLLERVYKIDEMKILHIHGSIADYDDPPVIGHGNTEKIEAARKQVKEAENEFWEKGISAYSALEHYYDRTHKDVSHYMSFNKSFFDKLSSVNSVHVIGHSFGQVDLPYFREVAKSLKPQVKWNVYFYNDNEEIEFSNRLKEIGVPRGNIHMRPSSEFYHH